MRQLNCFKDKTYLVAGFVNFNIHIVAGKLKMTFFDIFQHFILPATSEFWSMVTLHHDGFMLNG